MYKNTVRALLIAAVVAAAGIGFVGMGAAARAGTYEAPLDTRADQPANPVKFVAAPKLAVLDNGTVKISFELSAASDVEVAILAADGKVVRHLAAGLLGKHAPAPLAADSLRQELVWDRKDDLGAAVAGNGFQARVRAGSTARLDRVLGFDGNTLADEVVGLCVGPHGELYVMEAEPHGTRTFIRAFDKDGRYVKTLLPYSAATPAERAKPIGQLEIEGQRMPIVFDALGGNLAPLTSGMKFQRMVFSPKGHLLLASAVGCIVNHRPPRYLLAVHPEGGAPVETGFVGPQIRGLADRGIGFAGGQAEANSPWFTGLATSPDGEWIYLTDSTSHSYFTATHGVFRVKWADRTVGAPRRGKEYRDFGPDDLGKPFLGKLGESGDDDAHFKDPQGLDTDAKGNLYVCDAGNNRVMVFSPEGKLMTQWAVDKPHQIAVHPKSGVIYLLSTDIHVRRGKELPVLYKFSAIAAGPPKKLASLPCNITVMALDAQSAPTKLWAGTGDPAKGGLRPITDEGETFKLGEAVGNNNGLRGPGCLTGDPDRNRVVYTEAGIWSMDLTTGKRTQLVKENAAEAVLDAEGNLVVIGGYENSTMFRYDSAGRPLPWKGSTSNKTNVGLITGLTPSGHCIAGNGDIYLLRTNKWDGGAGNRVDVFSPDGKSKRRNLVDGLQPGDSGIGVDAAGNMYVGINAKPKEHPLPIAFAGKVPADAWDYWRFDKQGPRDAPWCYPYVNPYMNQLGSLFKFGPEGGAVYGFAGPYSQEKGKPKPDPAAPPIASIDNAPAGAATYWSGYMHKECRVAGALWRYAGIGPMPSDFGWGDPGCCCPKTRLAVDPYGRVFAPNVFQFGVEMLDANGNHIARIGGYGNPDDGGPGSKRTGPEIAFAWPTYASMAGDKVYVSDSMDCRITVVRFDWQAEAKAAP